MLWQVEDQGDLGTRNRYRLMLIVVEILRRARAINHPIFENGSHRPHRSTDLLRGGRLVGLFFAACHRPKNRLDVVLFALPHLFRELPVRCVDILCEAPQSVVVARANQS